MPKEYNVTIIGFGTVGAGVADILLNNSEVITPGEAFHEHSPHAAPMPDDNDTAHTKALHTFQNSGKDLRTTEGLSTVTACPVARPRREQDIASR